MTTKIGTITVPGLVWDDKYQHSQIEATETRAADGALVIQMGRKIKGRPITLLGDDSCWLTATQLTELQAFADLGEVFTLTRGDFTAQVMFRYAEAPVIESALLFNHDDTEHDATQSDITHDIKKIKLIEV